MCTRMPCSQSLLHLVFFAVLLLIPRNILATDYCNPILHNLPDTIVALINEKVFLTCEVSTTGSGDSTDLILDNIHSAGANNMIDAMYTAKNITWTYFSSDPNDDITGYNITIIAGENNNGTTFQCRANDCLTKKARLIVIKTPPSPPISSTVQLLNTTAPSIFKITSLINTPSLSDYPIFTASMSSSPTIFPSIIEIPNTACINADVSIYIYGLSVGIVLLIIMIITVIISMIYIIKSHAKSKPTSEKNSHNICYHDYKEC